MVDAVAGPMVICAAIFLAVLLNFILRVNQRSVVPHLLRAY